MKTGNILLLLILLGVFYALMILPQRRQQKQRATMMQQLAPGAKILTAGGMYATVVAIHDSGLSATIADGIQVELDNRAVLRVVEGAPSSDVNPDLESDVSRDVE